MKTSPIFMIGTQRSGSNLLRLMLNQLPEIVAPHPPHILQRMMPLAQAYGDLSDSKNFAALVDDVCYLVEANPVPWEGVTLDRRDVAKRCREKSLISLYGAVYDLYAEAKGAEAWCCKSLANVNYLPQMEAYFQRPRYIYLYRDGRDVAVSFRKAVVGEKHFYHIAKEWVKAQELAVKHREKIDPERFLNIQYEHLVANPKKSAQQICNFLGLPYRHAMLDYHKSEEAKRTASSSELWGNVTVPVMKNNTQKFLREASEGDIRVFESVAGHILDALGYKRVSIKKGEEIRFTETDIATFGAENQHLKEKFRGQVDPADLMRRDRQEGILQNIRSRLSANAGVI
jgi:hypothetical protein